MNHSPAENTALTKLEQALAAGTLPIHARKAGQRLLDRVTSPVNCVVMGLQNSGKSTLLNFLLGQAVVPETIDTPILELAWAEASRTIVTKTDGATTVLQGRGTMDASMKAIASVKIEADMPILKRLNLFEVGLVGSAADQMAAVEWAIGRADIVLWCTQEFLPREQKLWARVPDAVKDHGFLVLTKADMLAAQGALVQTIASVQDVAADEFHSVFPIATIQAIDAAKKGSEAGAPALKASGGSALMSAALKLAGQGRSADMDSALVFLDRHMRKASAKKAGTASAPGEGRVAVAAENDADAQPMLSVDLAVAALEYLKGRASGLASISAGPADPNPSDILNYCGETANGLADIVAEQNAGDPAIAELHDVLLDAAELLLLMEMESGLGPAADAVTVLLQARRGLEYRTAA